MEIVTKIPVAYLANPYGFNQHGREALKKIIPILENVGLKVLEPFEESSTSPLLEKVICLENDISSLQSDLDVARCQFYTEVGKRNIELMDKADCMIALLDGADVDSGTASEVGYFYGKNINGPFKPIFGLRTDMRQCEPGAPANIQVVQFITEVEYMVIAEVCKESVWLKGLFV